MAISSQQNVNFVQVLYPKQAVPGVAGADAVPSNSITDAGGIVRAANDGDREAVNKVAGGEGGPDFVCTAVTTAADTVNFDIPFASLLKLYAAQQSGTSFLVVKAKVTSMGITAVANSSYIEQTAAFVDLAGTMTVLATQNAMVVGAANTAAMTNNGANTLRIACTQTGAVAHNLRCEVFVQHQQ